MDSFHSIEMVNYSRKLHYIRQRIVSARVGERGKKTAAAK